MIVLFFLTFFLCIETFGLLLHYFRSKLCILFFDALLCLKFYDSKVQFSNYQQHSLYAILLPLKLVLPILLLTTNLDFIIMFHHSHRTVFTVKKILSLWSATTLLFSSIQNYFRSCYSQLSIATTTVISNWTICSIIISSSNYW